LLQEKKGSCILELDGFLKLWQFMAFHVMDVNEEQLSNAWRPMLLRL
jgi:hypothetical protein